MIIFSPRFLQQRSVWPRAFGKNRERLKILTLWATLKKIFENVGYTDFGSIND
jgi:hypothetical protein